MTCVRVNESTIICMAPPAIRLRRGVWMEFHEYFGPQFYRNRALTKVIHDWAYRQDILEVFEPWVRRNYATCNQAD